MMKVRVTYFQALKGLAGIDGEDLDLAEGSTIRDAVDNIVARRPALGPARRSLLHAVNEEWAPADAVLRDGDALALMPPVSGG